MTQPIKKNRASDKEIYIGRVKLAEKALFAKQLAVALKAGLSITEALSIAGDSAKGRLKNIIGVVLKSARTGRPLSQALQAHKKVFSKAFISTVKAGETSGTLTENLEDIAERLDKEKKLLAKIKGAMLYPVAVLIAAGFLGIAIAFFVLPKITPMFEGLKVDLPITTRWLIWFSNLMRDNGFLLVIGLVAFIVFLVWLARRSFVKPVTHWMFLNIPVIKKVVKNANLARFCRTLGMLLRSGLTISEALDITEQTLGNYYYQNALSSIATRVSKGTKLSNNLKRFDKLFPSMTFKMVGVGEKSGKIEETLLYLADFYENEVDTATKSLSTIIEPILLIIVGLGVGILALSIITPIYKITGNIQQ